jgi:hypothetical protein
LSILKALGIADVNAIRAAQQVGESHFALFEGQHPQVAFPDAQQIERPKGLEVIAIGALERLEVGKALPIECRDLSIKDDIADTQASYRTHQIRETKAEIVAAL